MSAWLAPESLEGVLALRSDLGAGATVLAGGTAVGALINQGSPAPRALLSLARVPGLDRVEDVDGELRVGAMATQGAVERSPIVRRGWPVLARALARVASPRVRNQATLGGVVADADYACDPPALLAALEARAVLRSARGERVVGIAELIRGHHVTAIAEDELLLQLRVPPAPGRAVFRRFSSGSSADRPCVAVAAMRGPAGLRVVVGAAAERLHELPEVCALADASLPDSLLAAEIGRRYAAGIEAVSDLRGSAAYRRRVIAAEVRRAVEALA